MIPLAEGAIESGSYRHLADLHVGAFVIQRPGSVCCQLVDGVKAVLQLIAQNIGQEAMLGYEVFSHHLYEAMSATDHHDAGVWRSLAVEPILEVSATD